uniref:NBS-LRR class disease resistance protein Pikh-1 n=1 Tax=Oryza sativa subsp. japonica TaxID=39947 RepID=UPI0010A1F8AD|nr:Chain B, NBS-LRR class disease resistance protein Pikh-1 [Oryza sativa Japonica Group]6R8M_A Chain A, NBS-LRR class disease resistance protein Pikh-1 [Oryza sativa]6R8M_B Chain B, NBS-LRR class disease resistance protein Pikh-1 [Oryza sativa]6R8M_E Chain E, NBS-LRR class disease resistance protein Pikh-1 [Oryza sativa]6R8M_F Chain F, NBS-LRR class disease resistance protein Pikh-1 [Oryza sativa]
GPGLKQKIVIKVAMEGNNCRSKAMALVASTGGVDSVALVGDLRDKIEVVGYGIDPIKLISALRKKVGDAELLQVSQAKED